MPGFNCPKWCIDLTITDDTNLFLYGCHRMMLGLFDDGSGSTIDLRHIHMVSSLPDISMFSPKRFWEWCVLSGASDHWEMPSGLSYLPCLHGMGLINSFKFIRKFEEMTTWVVESLKSNQLFKVCHHNYLSNLESVGRFSSISLFVIYMTSLVSLILDFRRGCCRPPYP